MAPPCLTSPPHRPSPPHLRPLPSPPHRPSLPHLTAPPCLTSSHLRPLPTSPLAIQQCRRFSTHQQCNQASLECEEPSNGDPWKSSVKYMYDEITSSSTHTKTHTHTHVHSLTHTHMHSLTHTYIQLYTHTYSQAYDHTQSSQSSRSSSDSPNVKTQYLQLSSCHPSFTRPQDVLKLLVSERSTVSGHFCSGLYSKQLSAYLPRPSDPTHIN